MHFQMSGSKSAVFRRPKTSANTSRRSWTSRQQCLRPIHRHLDRAARLLGKQDRRNRDVVRKLAAKAPTDLRRNDPDGRDRDAKNLADLIPDTKMPL